MNFRIKLGEIVPGLCGKCTHATVMSVEGRGLQVYCSAIAGIMSEKPGRISGVVTECTSYTERGTMELYEMKRIAWVIQFDKHKKPIGFMPPKDERQRWQPVNREKTPEEMTEEQIGEQIEEEGTRVAPHAP